MRSQTSMIATAASVVSLASLTSMVLAREYQIEPSSVPLGDRGKSDAYSSSRSNCLHLCRILVSAGDDNLPIDLCRDRPRNDAGQYV
jgi:hypothetical protein